ncbi:MAG: molybdate ABC transporter substrate-binding protein [Chloroflexi bacterium]|nr:molybdate ABC transporter substrate-binding protein [Chloroflexota bacterium]
MAHRLWNGASLATLAILILLASACSAQPRSDANVKSRQILVSAAISLKDAFDEIEREFEKDNPDVTVTFNYGASGSLQLQIEQGAPVDVFASAGQAEMDALERKGLLVPGSRDIFAANSAVLIVPRDSSLPIGSFSDLARPEIKRIAIGNPSSVPAGAYARQILQHAGVWDQIQTRLVFSQNVRQVLTYVEQGNVEAGIVYSTDAATSSKVEVVAVATEKSSQPVLYPIAVVAGSRQLREAKAFVEMVSGAKGEAILIKHGFPPLPVATPNTTR